MPIPPRLGIGAFFRAQSLAGRYAQEMLGISRFGIDPHCSEMTDAAAQQDVFPCFQWLGNATGNRCIVNLLLFTMKCCIAALVDDSGKGAIDNLEQLPAVLDKLQLD